jgi:hypothetical protein
LPTIQTEPVSRFDDYQKQNDGRGIEPVERDVVDDVVFGHGTRADVETACETTGGGPPGREMGCALFSFATL